MSDERISRLSNCQKLWILNSCHAILCNICINLYLNPNIHNLHFHNECFPASVTPLGEEFLICIWSQLSPWCCSSSLLCNSHPYWKWLWNGPISSQEIYIIKMETLWIKWAQFYILKTISITIAEYSSHTCARVCKLLFAQYLTVIRKQHRPLI